MRAVRLTAASILTLGLCLNLTPAHADDTSPAAPDCRFDSAELSDPTVSVGISKLVTVRVTATATSCDAYASASLEFGSRSISGRFDSSPDDPTQWSGTVSIDPQSLLNSDAGTWAGSVNFEDGDERALGATLTVKHATRLDYFEPPKRVKKNKTFWVGDILNQADWDNGWYGALENQRVSLQFRTPKGHYKTIKTVRSMQDQQGGTIQTGLKLKKSGYLRWMYAGSSTVQSATTVGHLVKVKK